MGHTCFQNEVEDWIRLNPKFEKIKHHSEFVNTLYLNLHPFVKIMIFGGQEAIIYDKEKIIEFSLKKGFIFGCWTKFGWSKNVPAIGINEELLKFALRNSMTIRVVFKNELRFVTPTTIQQILDSKWVVKKVGNGLQIFAIPLHMTSRKLKSTVQKLGDSITDYA